MKNNTEAENMRMTKLYSAVCKFNFPASFRVQTSVCFLRQRSAAEEHAQTWTLNTGKTPQNLIYTLFSHLMNIFLRIENL